jgi:predicted PolB exonuclease-like 3'-5' exonuclease
MKPPAASTLVLDIETVPDADLYSPPEPALDGDRPFPPLYACTPVVVGLMWLDESFACKSMGIIGEGKDEAGVLAVFAALMAERPRLVTWNGRSFDLPVLTLRALRHGVAFPWYYQDRDYRDRHGGDRHVDLCDLLAGHGAARMTSLDGAARLIGLPGKSGVDGSQVEALYRAGQIEALRQYCLSDVAQTAFVFLRYLLLTGQLERARYQRAAADLLATISADGRVARVVSGADRARLLLGDG